MERRNKALLIFGTILFATGLLASFYQVTLRVGQPPGLVLYQIVAPYQGAGIILLVSGMTFIALGFLHLTTSKKMVERNKPVGIVMICFLTLFASVLYGFFGAMSIGVWALTGGATGEGNASLVLLDALPFFVMALYAFLLSILLFIGDSKPVWCGAIVFWVSNGIFWALLVISSAHFGEADLLPLDLTALAVPLLYSLSCLGYFMTSHVRRCFDV